MNSLVNYNSREYFILILASRKAEIGVILGRNMCKHRRVYLSRKALSDRYQNCLSAWRPCQNPPKKFPDRSDGFDQISNSLAVQRALTRLTNESMQWRNLWPRYPRVQRDVRACSGGCHLGEICVFVTPPKHFLDQTKKSNEAHMRHPINSNDV